MVSSTKKHTFGSHQRSCDYGNINNNNNISLEDFGKCNGVFDKIIFSNTCKFKSLSVFLDICYFIISLLHASNSTFTSFNLHQCLLFQYKGYGCGPLPSQGTGHAEKLQIWDSVGSISFNQQHLILFKSTNNANFYSDGQKRR